MQPTILVLTRHQSLLGPLASSILRREVRGAAEVVSAAMEPSPLDPDLPGTLSEGGLPAETLQVRPAKALLGRSSFHTAIIVSSTDTPDRPKFFFGARHCVHWDVLDPRRLEGDHRRQALRECRDRLMKLSQEWCAGFVASMAQLTA